LHLAAGYAEIVKLEKQSHGLGQPPKPDRAWQQQALNLWRWVLIGSALAPPTMVLAWLSIPIAHVGILNAAADNFVWPAWGLDDTTKGDMFKHSNFSRD
jgi:hypothetical protein